MCGFCNEEYYIKVIQYLKPVIAPLTVAEEIRHTLIDLTGESYKRIKPLYCPMCGRKLGE